MHAAPRFSSNFGLIAALRKTSLPKPVISSDAFSAANEITDGLLAEGWQYDNRTYQFPHMLRKKKGNCLGLSCLYGHILKSTGFEPQFELVVGPFGYQRQFEKNVLERLLSGEAFSFDTPLLPERQMSGENLLSFCTLEHPRLVLDNKRFETTTLAYQDPSEIEGEYTRLLSWQALIGLVLYEQASAACCGAKFDFPVSWELLNEASRQDPDNREVHSEKAMLALYGFDDDGYQSACNAYEEFDGDDSQFYLQRYHFFGDGADLDKGLQGNPTDMRLWTLRHVIGEQDIRTQRANFAVAAQCIARSEVLNLGEFYCLHSALMEKLFPEDALDLLKLARNARTNKFGFHLALMALLLKKGCCKWEKHLQAILKKYPPQTPLQEVQLFFHLQHLAAGERQWKDLYAKHERSCTFQRTIASLKQQWN